MKQDSTDWKFVIGMVILIAILVLIAVFFWKTVARQAADDLRVEQEAAASFRRAVAVRTGDVLKETVFVDMDTDEVFFAEIPEEGIYNRNAVLVRGDVLEYGDMVQIYSLEELTADRPPVLPGVTKMQRIGRGDLETVQQYQDIVDSYGSMNVDSTDSHGDAVSSDGTGSHGDAVNADDTDDAANTEDTANKGR